MFCVFFLNETLAPKCVCVCVCVMYHNHLHQECSRTWESLWIGKYLWIGIILYIHYVSPIKNITCIILFGSINRLQYTLSHNRILHWSDTCTKHSCFPHFNKNALFRIILFTASRYLTCGINDWCC